MIQFKIIGKGYLELPSDFDFSFKYSNSVFAFENMQMSRSGEFTIPETPTNNQLLGFANDAAKFGETVRRKLSTELYYSGGRITGILSIGKFDSDAGFSAIFIYGEFLELKRISELGNIGNYTQTVSTAICDKAYIDSSYFANGLFANNFRFYNYRNGIADADKLDGKVNLSPTVTLANLLSISASGAGLTVDTSTIGTAKDGIGVILAGNRASAVLEAVTVSGIPNSTLNFSGGSDFFILDDKKFKYKPFASIFYFSQNVKVLKVKKDCKIRFETTNLAVACVTGDGRTFLSTGYADGYFRGILEGTEIPLKTGDYFTFVHSTDYRFDTADENFDTSVSVAFKVYAGDLATVDYGDDYPLKENLPEITLIDILKTYANLFRCGLLYDQQTNTVSFFNYAFDKSAAVDLTDSLIKIKSVDRTFLDYAQRNIINCKSEDYVLENDSNRFEITYRVDNDNLQTEKTLYTLPFSEGILGENNDVIVNDFELIDPFKKTAKIGTLALASKTSGQVYMKHIRQLYNNFTISNNLGEIINKSTTVEMSVKMDVKTFISIKNTDTFKVSGQYYCCLEATHSKGVASFVFLKI